MLKRETTLSPTWRTVLAVIGCNWGTLFIVRSTYNCFSTFRSPPCCFTSLTGDSNSAYTAPQAIPGFLFSTSILRASTTFFCVKERLIYPNPGTVVLLGLTVSSTSLAITIRTSPWLSSKLAPFISNANTASAVATGEFHCCVCFCFNNQSFISSTVSVLPPVCSSASITSTWACICIPPHVYGFSLKAKNIPCSSVFVRCSFREATNSCASFLRPALSSTMAAIAFVSIEGEVSNSPTLER